MEQTERILGKKIRARGAQSNVVGRFERHQIDAVDDGWHVEQVVDPLKAVVQSIPAKSMITKNTSPDVPFDQSINPYRGCEHGCIYCFARPSHCYLGYSVGLDFETQIIARPNASQVLARELGRQSYVPRILAVGTNTDPYQPCERDEQVWRGCLEVLAACRHPLGLVTKGALIERDLDILAQMAVQGLVSVGISITTLDPDLCRKMEPRAPSPQKRLNMIRALRDAGIKPRVMIAPVIPGLTDHEIEPILTAARDHGATHASYIMLRLPLEVRDLFQEWVTAHVPNKANKIFNALRSMRGGDLNVSEFGERMRGTGPIANLCARRFHVGRKRLGYETEALKLRTDLFRPPAKDDRQGDLFD
jgi:DNA repair photolyase